MIIMLLIGIFGGFISGLVGIGGAIIIYPMLLLLPPLVGLPTYSAYIASGLTSSQVFFSTLSGSFKAYKNKDFSRTLVLNMGSGMIIGSILGAILANLINVQFVNCLLYTSDAADEGLGVDLGGRRIIKKKIWV